MDRKLPAQSAAEKMRLPAEVMPGAARITLSGTSEALIENHAGLMLVSDECVSFRTRGGECRITGQRLYLAFMDKFSTVVRGFIVGVEFF